MTLIEVLGGLAILGTLLVALLVARDRHARQWQRAGERVEAARVADDLLTAWWAEPAKFPRRSAGTVGEWRWRTDDATDADARRLGLAVVRLRVWPADDLGAVPVTIDVALPPEGGL